jgi:hypothetical protein
MNTIICVEIMGPFKETGNISSTSNNLCTVYLEFPNTVGDLKTNRQKSEKYLNNKYDMIRELNKTVEDEQPIPPGVFIITSIMIMDEYMINVLESKFVGYNVINKHNKLEQYTKENIIKPRSNMARDGVMFVTPDGIGFTFS